MQLGDELQRTRLKGSLITEFANSVSLLLIVFGLKPYMRGLAAGKVMASCLVPIEPHMVVVLE